MWQGTGPVEDILQNLESKNPDNLLHSWRSEKITGAY